MTKIRKRSFFNRTFTYLFMIIILFIAYVLIFLSSYGKPPWDKFFGTGGTLLLSAVSMYFGYQIEHRRSRRKREVHLLEDFLGKVSDLAEQIRRLSVASRPVRRRSWPNIREKSENLLIEMPSLMRISETEIRRQLAGYWDKIEAILQTVAEISIYKIEGNTREKTSSTRNYTTFAKKVYDDLQALVGEAKQILLSYESKE